MIGRKADIFLTPARIINGCKALSQSAGYLRQMGTKALIVTDSTMERLGNLGLLTDILDREGITYAVYSGVTGEPDDRMVKEGVFVYNKEGCDFLVGLGGGSPIDSMKAIAMIVTCKGRPADYLGKNITEKLVPMAAIPTTAGTGSEATQFTIITDRETQIKMLLKGPALIPELAVIDPEFTMSLPPAITAFTGVDALTHAIEAYTSRKAQPLSDTFALSACQRLFKNLKQAWACGEDEECRIQMSLGALEAGIAFNNSSVTLVHGMSRPIGALFHVPHGLSNAMLLSICLEYAAPQALDRFAQIAAACGFADPKDPQGQAVDKLLQAVRQLLKDIGIPSLQAYGISREEFFEAIPKMARDAYASGSPSNTRREVTVEAMEILYKKLWQGREAG